MAELLVSSFGILLIALGATAATALVVVSGLIVANWREPLNAGHRSAPAADAFAAPMLTTKR